MNKDKIEEGKEIFKKLSFENQVYFMTLVRLAENVEKNLKRKKHK